MRKDQKERGTSPVVETRRHHFHRAKPLGVVAVYLYFSAMLHGIRRLLVRDSSVKSCCKLLMIRKLTIH